jgi:hypothetical protein
MSNEHINDEDAMEHLDSIDKEHGINKPIEEASVDVEQTKSLGKAKSYDVSLSEAEESPWKLLNLNLLPSNGMFYPADIELLVKSAKTKEIRHWSTMDEHDPIDVREKINFVLNKCTKFKIRGNPSPFNFNDYLDVDKYHILFRIYELTFPNQENKLMANIKCPNTKCKHVNRIQVTSQNLLGFKIPPELEKWYSHENRCFTIPSEKLGETLTIYLPKSGTLNKFRQKKKSEVNAGIEVDDSFYDFGPYLVSDWRKLSMDDISNLKMESNSWSTEKFTAIYKITDMLKKASLNRAAGVCEKCKTGMESNIFLGGSFTVKDIFIVSARLDELI